MVNRKRLTKDELAKLNSLFNIRRTGAAQQQLLNEFWQLLVEKYHFHPDHTIIDNETGEIVDNCYHHKSMESKNLENAEKNHLKSISSRNKCVV
jgi:hypothetical protein